MEGWSSCGYAIESLRVWILGKWLGMSRRVGGEVWGVVGIEVAESKSKMPW